jgi:hypothetical protein
VQNNDLDAGAPGAGAKPGIPAGSHRHGYEFVLPLSGSGRIDRKAYRKTPELCTVHRFWEGSGDLIGTIHHTSHDRWMFSFHAGQMEDEPIPRFAEHVFREGEYMTVRETAGGEHTFRIAPVEPAPGLASAKKESPIPTGSP